MTKEGKVAQSLHRLDKRAKSRTQQESRSKLYLALKMAASDAEYRLSQRAIPDDRTRATIAYRPWSDEWRLRISPEVPTHSPPPLHFGPRYTTALNSKALSKIMDSGAYVEKKLGGFQVFGTITLNKEAREKLKKRLPVYKLITHDHSGYRRTHSKNPRIGYDHVCRAGDEFGKYPPENGLFCPVRYDKVPKEELEFVGPRVSKKYVFETSLQKEVSRFFNSIKKMRLRGWVPKYQRFRRRVQRKNGDYTPIDWNEDAKKVGNNDRKETDFAYLWVAECPKNEKGEDNPHVHFLMNWSVDFGWFPCWAKRIESIWGNGSVHLEKIRKSESSTAYLSKAIGYLSKSGSMSDQGRIRGNRYAISASARAPGWESVGQYSAACLGEIMMLARLKHQEKYSKLFATKNEIQHQVADIPEKEKKVRYQKKKVIHAISGRIQTIKSVIGRYNAIFKGEKAFDGFIKWATRLGWKMNNPPKSGHIKEIRNSIREKIDQQKLNDFKINDLGYFKGYELIYDDIVSWISSKRSYLVDYSLWKNFTSLEVN